VLSATIAAVAVAIAGCGGSTKASTQTSAVSSTAAAPATSTAQATTTASSTSAAPTTTASASTGSQDPVTVKGKTGDTLTLRGDGLGPNGPTTKSRLEVTLKGVRGPFSGFDVPAGQKLIGLDLQMVNVGTVKYSDPLPEGTLTLAGGGTGKLTSLIAASGPNPCPNPSLKLAHGQAQNFCEAFQVPTDAKPEAFEYAADNGYGDTGLWRLAR
jgi:hypothetical protein